MSEAKTAVERLRSTRSYIEMSTQMHLLPGEERTLNRSD